MLTNEIKETMFLVIYVLNMESLVTAYNDDTFNVHNPRWKHQIMIEGRWGIKEQLDDTIIALSSLRCHVMSLH